MRKILLVLDGAMAREFLEALRQKYTGKNQYVVVATSPEVVPSKLPENFEIHYFDPTSLMRFEEVLSRDISDAFVIMEEPRAREVVYEAIRAFSSRVRLTILEGKKNPNDKYLQVLSVAPLIASRLMENLPDIPVVARNIGLGEGEVMQVNVPFGSSFAYRTLSSIKQKNWKIVALYRGGRLILAKSSLVIQPNDSLLIIGESSVLLEVYHRIKEDMGQFPAPFGSHIFFYADMARESFEEIKRGVEEALWLHRKLKNNRLYLCIINPRDFDALEEIKAYDEGKSISVEMKYHARTLLEALREDNERNRGLVILSDKLFSTSLHRRVLHELGVPVMKLGEARFSEGSESVVVLGDRSGESEKISSVVFDLSSQIGNRVCVYDFDPDSSFRSESLEHYDNVARILNKKLEVITSSTQNPILWLQTRQNVLQILPYNKDVARARFFWFFSTNIERLCFQLKRHHQLFIPVSL